MRSQYPAGGFWAAILVCFLVDFLFLGHALLSDDVRAPAADIDYALPYAQEFNVRPDPCANIYLIDWSHSVHSWQRLVRDSYLKGQLPLWNDRAGCGQPLLGNLQTEIFSPYQPINLIAGDQYVDWRQLATLLVAQVCSLFLIYVLGLSPWAGLVAAIGFSFGSYMQVWSVLPVVGSAAFSPAIFASFICLRRRFSWTTVSWGGLVVGLSILSGHIESTFMACLAACGVTFLAGGDRNEGMPQALRARALFVFQAGLVGLVGLGLAACQLLPFFDYLDQSLVMSIRKSAPQVTIPPRQVLALMDPKAFGFPTDAGGYFGAKNYLEAIVHVGRVVLALSLVGLIGGIWARRKFVIPLFLIVTFSIALAFSPPSFHDKIQFFPFNVMPMMRMHFVGSMLLPVLAAFGLDFIMNSIKKRQIVAKRIAMATLILLALFHVVLLSFFAPRPENIGAFAIGGVDFIGPLIFLGMTAAVLIFWRHGKKRAPWLCAVLLLSVAILESTTLWWPFVPLGKATSLSPQSPSIEYIEEKTERLRLLPSEKQLTPELGNLHDITSLKVYDGMGMARHTALFFFQGGLYGVTTHLPIFGIQPATLDMLSVGWTLTEWAPERSLLPMGEQVLASGHESEFPFVYQEGVPLEFIVSQSGKQALVPGAFELSMWTKDEAKLTWVLGEEGKANSMGAIHAKADDAMRSYLNNLDRIFDRPHTYIAFQPTSSIKTGTRMTGKIRVATTSPSIHLRVIARDGLQAKEVFQHRGIFVGRRETAMPRSYLAAATTFCQPEPSKNDDEPLDVRFMRQAIADVSASGFDPHKVTILESGERSDFSIPHRVSSEPTALVVKKLASGRFLIDSEKQDSSVLVFSECYDRGWRARIDGELTDIIPANVCSMAVALPPGRHTIEFYFWPRSLTVGFAITFATLLFVIAVLIYGRRPATLGR